MADMRKLKSVLAVIAAMSLLAGCGEKKTSEKNDTTEAVTTTAAETTETATEGSGSAASEEELIELSRKILDDIANDNFKTACDLFSKDLKDQLTEEMLIEGWQNIKDEGGKILNVKESRVESEQGMTVIITPIDFEKTDFDFLLAFNSEGGIDGIMFMYPQDNEIEPQVTATFAETIVTVGEHELNGMLTMPKNAEKPPLVILIQGSGQHNMNEGIGELATFNELAHGLAERGIATLRYNKRFFQIPELQGDGNYTIQDEVLDDADAAVKLAKSYVDEGKVSSIYVMGHSLGGCLAPTIAQKNSDVKGIISLAGTPRDLVEVIIDQLTAQKEEASGDAAKNSVQKSLDDAAVMKEGNDESAFLLGWGYKYYNSLRELKVGETVKSLDIPMLFLQGDADIQVYPDKDFPLWKEYLDGKANCTFKLYEGLGHFFDDEDGHFNKQVMDDTAEFIKNSEK